MEHEFIDEMFERLLDRENKTYGIAFATIFEQRAETIRDLGRIENAYQLFCKKHPEAGKHYFRMWLRDTRRSDYDKCVNCFRWPEIPN